MGEAEKSMKEKKALLTLGILSFVSITIVFFYVFKNATVDLSISTVMSVISGGIVVWIILSIAGILREFSIKSPLFEMSSKLEKKIDEGNKEVCGKINILNQNIQSINTRIDTVMMNVSTSNAKAEVKNIENYYESKEQLSATLNESGITSNQIDPKKKIPEEHLEKISSLFNRVKTLEELIEHTQHNIREMMQTANYYFYKKKFDKAIENYDRVLVLDPRNIDALFNKAYSYGEIAEHEKAIEYYKKALEIRPSPDVLCNLCNEYLAIGDDKKEFECLEKALKIDPDFVGALSNMGAYYIRKKKYEIALEYLEKALKIDPKNANAMYNKACVKALMGEKDEAINLLERVIKIDSICRDDAKKEGDFESIKNDPRFKKLTE